MKFTNWQLVAILGILLAAVICAHVFAPGATAFAVSVATTIIGTLFVSRQPPPPGGGTGSPPALTLVSGVLVCLALFGCGAALNDLTQDANRDRLSECRADARAAYYVDGKSEAQALAVYDACVAKKPVTK